MINLLEIIKDDLKLDFTQTFIDRWGGNGVESDFEILPREFLRFAKADFSENSTKGFINSLTNSKRAIDCQIDSALDLYGIDFENLSDVSKPLIEAASLDSENISYKFKLIGALNFAPSIIISDVRNLRNKLEHQYKKPTKKEVKDALELAELFISAVENKVKFIEEGFTLSEKKSHKYIKKEHRDFYDKAIDFNFDFKNRWIEVFKRVENKSDGDPMIIDRKNPVYYFLVRIFVDINEEYDIKEALGLLLNYLGHPIPNKHIDLTIK